jgi:hypothetical protein
MPRFWHILAVMSGQELPAKIKVPRMVSALLECGFGRENWEIFRFLSRKSGWQEWANQNYNSARPANGGGVPGWG